MGHRRLSHAGVIVASTMPSPSELAELLIPLDPRSDEPLHRQLYRGIREAILGRRLTPGVRLPSTRNLAQSLGVSRTTVLFAFDQLVAEGFIQGAVGSGSYVARQMPDHLLADRRDSAPADAVPARLSVRGESLRDMPRVMRRVLPDPRPFRTGVPPVDQFPLAVWTRLAVRRYRGLSASQLYHGPAAGYRPLREAIAAHLVAARGMRCSADSVIVLSSAQEAMELACKVLLDPGDTVWLEDPCWSGAHGALRAAGARIVPVPVDGAGLDVQRGIELGPDARLVYLTPSHQYPAGVTMNLERRLQLLDWASANHAWILEDDYDSEYRYSGRPLTSLQGLDTAGRVLYVGTFNKSVYPALRLGYLVVPESLTDGVLAARRIGGQHAPTVEQAILTDFLVEGHYARLMHRMRTVCRERRDALVAAAGEAPDLLEITHTETGLHAVAWLPAELDDKAASQAALRHDVETAPLSSFYLGACPRGGLVLGYSALTPEVITEGIERLIAALREVQQKP